MTKTDSVIEKYKDELIELLHKSQDSFEKQLSYLSAGSLALSIGFIKDVIKNMKDAHWKYLLPIGWTLLCLTLLINCISHIRAAGLHNKTISEIQKGQYNDVTVSKRYKEVGYVNWFTVATLVLGIISIVIFISKNIYNEQVN